MRNPKQLLALSIALTIAGFSAPLLAQGNDPFGALRGMLNGLQSQKTATGPASRSPAQAELALRGKWQSDLSDCYQPTDTVVFGAKQSWSGYEWSCDVPATAYNSRGFAGELICAAEGEEYRSKTRVELAEDGQSVTVFRPDDGTSEKLFKCPKETESISF